MQLQVISHGKNPQQNVISLFPLLLEGRVWYEYSVSWERPLEACGLESLAARIHRFLLSCERCERFGCKAVSLRSFNDHRFSCKRSVEVAVKRRCSSRAESGNGARMKPNDKDEASGRKCLVSITFQLDCSLAKIPARGNSCGGNYLHTTFSLLKECGVFNCIN
jgi:hypothetical protein